jgi:uncharacterized protein (TIRG00374 family)
MIDVTSYISVIKSLDGRALEFLGIAVATYYISVFIYALRWKIVLSGMGRDIPLPELFKIILSSIFINNVTPMSRGGGEILRVTWVQKSTRCPWHFRPRAYSTRGFQR